MLVITAARAAFRALTTVTTIIAAIIMAILLDPLSTLRPLAALIATIVAFTCGRLPAAMIPGFRNPQPFRQFARANWLDITTQLGCLGLATALYNLSPPLLARTFVASPAAFTDSIGLRYAQDLRPEYISTTVMSILAFAIPAIIMGGVGGLWVLRDFNDSNAALTGLGYALSGSTLVVNLIKIFIGGLRPHFLVVCDPIIVARSPRAPFSPAIFATAALVCSNDDLCAVWEAQMSFPSGHACAAFAGFGFLSMWLFAHIKHTAAGPVPMWKGLIWVAPWVVAFLLAASKVRDGWHHPVDVAFGAALGTLAAALSYFAVFRGLADTTTNHLPR